MLAFAVIIFALAAVGGLVLASHVLRGRLAPWALSLAHALLGAVGLVTLVIMLMEGDAGQRLIAAFALLLVAALGGFFLASFHLRGKLAPKGVVVLHAGLAVIGFLTLLSLMI
ncbi:hypothetical protein [Alloalcanivorax sp.]|jgi:hypothetical protein|uniref:hypothetical protein n=1 Tax=Alloalcanivorax sp. TaxID=3020835 RepID=UPI0013253481|nr:hypothetical protein [Alcanivorax sp.]MED5602426.1 hypothetical protein [Pseudomonadota bacterium]MTI51964.1 hypothetical protein [Alcanivorax sp.]|tara:strand:- start:944 stop:1282 length:339 start_codon:yes stop_codon:yes gene_type:complete